MGQHIRPFLFEGEHLVRTADVDGDIRFVGVDVCRILEIAKPHQALDRLDDDERGTCIVGTPSGDQSMIVVSEPGVYQLVFSSRKPVAKRLKRWLAHEVIPSIRQTGSYSVEGDIIPPAPAEHRPFPDWPLEEMRTKKQVVDMYRLLYGCMAAQWVSPQMGFPPPPPELVEHGRQYAMTLVPMEAGE